MYEDNFFLFCEKKISMEPILHIFVQMYLEYKKDGFIFSLTYNSPTHFLFKRVAQMNVHVGACQFTQMGTKKRVVKIMFLLIWCWWTQARGLLTGRSMPL